MIRWLPGPYRRRPEFRGKDLIPHGIRLPYTLPP